MVRSTWFCVDIECTGPVPVTYDMVSLGCVVVVDASTSEGDGAALTIGESFYVEVVPTSGQVDPGAMAVHGLDLDALRETGASLPDALHALAAFVERHTVDGSTPVFVGHNAPFDWSFVNQGYHTAGLRTPFGYKAFDTKAFAAGVLGLHWLDTSKEVLAERLELPAVRPEQVHRADYDAWYQAHILIGLLERSRVARP